MKFPCFDVSYIVGDTSPMLPCLLVHSMGISRDTMGFFFFMKPEISQQRDGDSQTVAEVIGGIYGRLLSHMVIHR